jgi:hypothetical protein
MTAAAAAAVVSPSTIYMYEYNRNDVAPATLFVTSWDTPQKMTVLQKFYLIFVPE